MSAYLVFATLVVPPLAVRHLDHRRLAAAWMLGAPARVGLVVPPARPAERTGHRVDARVLGVVVYAVSVDATSPRHPPVTRMVEREADRARRSSAATIRL